MEANRKHFQSLASLQLIAIIAVVMGHLWFCEVKMMKSLCVSFCFVYSGFFTAMFHRFDSSYGLKDHARFMWDKLSKLYPVYFLSFVIYFISNIVWNGTYSMQSDILLAHLTLLSPWIPNADFYYGYNAVTWFVCVLFFLYLMAPLAVRALRQLKVTWQVLLMAALLALEFIGGYTATPESDSLWLNHYHMYQFPPMRLLDFGTGIIIYNITTTTGWKRLQAKLTPSLSTCIEVVGVLLFALLYWVQRNYLFELCYRAFCILFPAVVVLLMTFVLTSSNMGQISKILCLKPLPALSKISLEIYLLQIVVYYLFKPLFAMAGVDQMPLLYFLLQNSILIVVAWLIQRYYAKPINRLMTKAWERCFERKRHKTQQN